MNQKKGMNQQIEPRKGENKKKIQGQGGASLFKKNEFTLIIIGALAVTTAVFFLFFRSPGPGKTDLPADPGRLTQLDDRIKTLESLVEELKLLQEQGGISAESSGTDSSVKKDLVQVQQDLDRIENTVTLKIDALIRRMSGIEKQMSGISPEKAQAAAKPGGKTQKTASATMAAKPPVKKPAVASTKKTPMFHTVKKGETLWSISQQHKTTVANLRKLNNLTPESKIYPGINILIR